MTDSKNINRIYYLDNIRIFCMIFGVYYHAAALGSYPMVEKFLNLSAIFRMETFFLVSGFFLAIISEKKNTIKFLEKRTLVLMVPFISTLIFINPITIYLGYGYYNDLPYGSYSLLDPFKEIMSRTHGGPELHLWFLLILLMYTYIFFIFRPVFRKTAQWCDKDERPTLMSPVVFSVIYAIFLTVFTLVGRKIEYPRLAYPFMEDFPYFIVGVLAGYSKNVLLKVNKIGIPILITGLLGLLITELYRGPGWGPAGVFGNGLLSVSLVVFINWLFSRFLNGTSKTTQILSSTIYTVYLLHQFFIISIVAFFGLYFGELQSHTMLALSTLVICLGVATHMLIITKSKILNFMFSGKNIPLKSNNNIRT